MQVYQEFTLDVETIKEKRGKGLKFFVQSFRYLVQSLEELSFYIYTSYDKYLGIPKRVVVGKKFDNGWNIHYCLGRIKINFFQNMADLKLPFNSARTEQIPDDEKPPSFIKNP